PAVLDAIHGAVAEILGGHDDVLDQSREAALVGAFFGKGCPCESGGGHRLPKENTTYARILAAQALSPASGRADVINRHREGRSVPRTGRAGPIEAVVDSDRRHLDIVAPGRESVADQKWGTGRNGECSPAQPEIIVFDLQRKIVCESPFKAGSDQPPARRLPG